MKRAPFFPFYPQDWLDDTRIFDMGLEAEGAYIRLLALMWVRGGSVPDNERWLCNALRCTKSKWRGLRHTLIESANPVLFCSESEIFNPRLREELKNFEQKSIKNRSNINQRWKKTNVLGVKKSNKNNETNDTFVLQPKYYREAEGDLEGEGEGEKTANTRASANDMPPAAASPRFAQDYLQAVLDWAMGDEFWSQRVHTLADAERLLSKPGANGLKTQYEAARGAKKKNGRLSKAGVASAAVIASWIEKEVEHG
jgi:uncharacterized protein YdaU (DUF1376 family)